MMALLLVAVAVAAIATAFPASPVDAKPRGDPTLTVTASPPATQISSFSWVDIAGCGFQAGSVTLVMNSPTAMSFTAVAVDGGCISLHWTVNSAGSYKLDALQNVNGNKSSVVATTAFSVQ